MNDTKISVSAARPKASLRRSPTLTRHELRRLIAEMLG